MNVGRRCLNWGCGTGLPEDATWEHEQRVACGPGEGQGRRKACQGLADGSEDGVSGEQKGEAVLFIAIFLMMVLRPRS